MMHQSLLTGKHPFHLLEPIIAGVTVPRPLVLLVMPVLIRFTLRENASEIPT
ncbi:MAG TPA: hypothetical protein VGR71_14710 [Nitrospira sp.]|nr:hypothetical protein [Nitrospira sp.]